MDIKDNRVLLFVLIALGAIAFLWSLDWNKTNPLVQYAPKYIKPDTIYIKDKPTIKELKKVVTKYVPKTVTIYKIDTILRDSVIKDTINLGSTISTGKVIQNQLTPEGKLIVTDYSIPDRHTEITIDREGFLQVKVDSVQIKKEERRERRIKRARIAGAIVIFVAGIIVGR